MRTISERYGTQNSSIRSEGAVARCSGLPIFLRARATARTSPSGRHRLQQIVDCGNIECRQGKAVEGGTKDDGGRLFSSGERLRHTHAVHFRHGDIEKNEIRR
jgi:hypothetical protein